MTAYLTPGHDHQVWCDQAAHVRSVEEPGDAHCVGNVVSCRTLGGWWTQTSRGGRPVFVLDAHGGIDLTAEDLHNIHLNGHETVPSLAAQPIDRYDIVGLSRSALAELRHSGHHPHCDQVEHDRKKASGTRRAGECTGRVHRGALVDARLTGWWMYPTGDTPVFHLDSGIGEPFSAAQLWTLASALTHGGERELTRVVLAALAEVDDSHDARAALPDAFIV